MDFSDFVDFRPTVQSRMSGVAHRARILTAESRQNVGLSPGRDRCYTCVRGV